MVITIMAEPRSGSTSLGNWFYTQKHFTTLFEPITGKMMRWYQKGECPTKWKYYTKHLCVKEIYQPGVDYSKLLSISDKIIILYRENSDEQLASYNNATSTGNWHTHWKHTPTKIVNNPIITNRFESIKQGMREHYINNPNYFTTSYEKLYNGNGFSDLLNYLKIEDLSDIPFPYGFKYRVDDNLSEKLI